MVASLVDLRDHQEVVRLRVDRPASGNGNSRENWVRDSSRPDSRQGGGGLSQVVSVPRGRGSDTHRAREKEREREGQRQSERAREGASERERERERARARDTSITTLAVAIFATTPRLRLSTEGTAPSLERVGTVHGV